MNLLATNLLATNLAGMNLLAGILPKANSDYAAEVDALYMYLNIVTIFFTLLIAGLVVFFCVKYARKSDADRPAEIHGNNFLEITWSVVPFLFMLVMFVWGTTLHFKASRAPADAMEILVTGKQWMWKVQHPNGKREINDLHVPQGVPVKLTITSEDVIHSYYIPVQRLKRDAVPGRYTTYWFTAKDVGEYHIFCAEYCGAEHSMMKGKLHVMPESEYNAWLATGHNAPTMAVPVQGEAYPPGVIPDLPKPEVEEIEEMGDAPSTLDLEDAALIALGKKIFENPAAGNCATCHRPGPLAMQLPQAPCPDLRDWWGGVSEMIDGTKVKRDYGYARESLKNPLAKVVKGYIPGQMALGKPLTDNEIDALIAYLKTFGEAK